MPAACWYALPALALTMGACRPPRPPDTPEQVREREASEAFANRPIYTKLTPEVLAGITDDRLEQAVMDFIEQKVAGKENHKQEILRALPAGFRALDATWWVEIEVAAGGFRQYFRNTRGRYAADAVEGFRLFGLRPLAELMEQAIALAVQEQAMSQAMAQTPSDPPAGAAVSPRPDPFRSLDGRFDELAAEIGPKRIAFIRARPRLFVGE